VSVQRAHAEPLLTGDAPARDHAAGSIEQLTLAGATNLAAGAAGGVTLRPGGYLNGPAPVPVQGMPSVRHPAAAVQAAPLETVSPRIMPTEGAAAAGTPAQDVPPEAGTAVASEPSDLGPPESASAVPPAGAPAGPGAQAGPGAPAGLGAPAAAGSPDELVKKLFDPLLRRLKNELRLDRERRGVLTDLRH